MQVITLNYETHSFLGYPHLWRCFFLRDFGKKQVIKTIHMQKRRF